jgi:hypothetical protein
MIKVVAAQSNVITNIGAGRFRLRSVFIWVPVKNAGLMYLQIFNKNAGVVGTDAPDHVIPIPNVVNSAYSKRLKFSGGAGSNDYTTGLSFAVTTTSVGAVDIGAANRPKILIDYDGSTLGGAV